MTARLSAASSAGVRTFSKLPGCGGPSSLVAHKLTQTAASMASVNLDMVTSGPSRRPAARRYGVVVDPTGNSPILNVSCSVASEAAGHACRARWHRGDPGGPRDEQASWPDGDGVRPVRRLFAASAAGPGPPGRPGRRLIRTPEGDAGGREEG